MKKNTRLLLIIALAGSMGCSAYRINIQGFEVDRALTASTVTEKSSPSLRADRHTDRGVILERLGDYRRALSEYRKAIRLNPQQVRAWINMGNIWVKLRAPGEAITAYQKALELDPKHPHALNNLACILLEEDQNPEKAAKLLAQALEIDKENRYLYLDTLGWARFKQGQPQEAIALLQEALEKTPSTHTQLLAETHYHLGLILFSLGNNPEAQQQFEQSLTLSPNAERNRAIQELFKQD